MKHSFLVKVSFSKRTLFFILTIAFLASCDSFGEPFSPSKTKLEELNELKEESIIEPYVRFESGIPRFAQMKVIYNRKIENEPLIQSLGFFDKYSELFQLPVEQLHLKETGIVDRRNIKYIVLGQNLNGIPVLNAHITVHHRKDTIIATSGSWIPGLKSLPPPLIESVEANNLAKKHLSRKLKDVSIIGSAKLYYHYKGKLSQYVESSKELQLVYRVVLEGLPEKGPKSSWTYLIEGNNGVIKKIENNVNTKDFLVKTASNGNGNTDWFDHLGPLSEYPRPNGDLDNDGQDAIDIIHFIYDYYYSTFQRQSYDDSDHKVEVVVDQPAPSNISNAGAWYERGSEKIFVPNGSVNKFFLAHEYTHGISHHTVEFDYQNASGALEEGFADVFGNIINETVDNLENSIVNDVSETAAFFSSDPECDFSDPNYNDCGGVHTNTFLVQNIAYYMMQGGTWNNINITGRGQSIVEHYLYDLVFTSRLLPPDSDFQLFADCCLYLASRNGAGGLYWTELECTVRNTLAAAGFGLSLVDFDCDGFVDNLDIDDDNDGIPDEEDNCPHVQNTNQRNTDGDDFGNLCDEDDDNDGILDDEDNCPLIANPSQEDNLGTSRGDACDDTDRDGVFDNEDNCRYDPNRYQLDSDNDSIGNVCDNDDDNDGIPDEVDNCPIIYNPTQQDSDGDKWGDICDNCPAVSSSDRRDSDRDGLGNPCDNDDDNDGISDEFDNCPLNYNPDQLDSDNNGVGFVCDINERLATYGGYPSFKEFINATVRFIEGVPIKIPIEPCLNCPPWIRENYGMEIDINIPFKAEVRVVDDRGFHVEVQNIIERGNLLFHIDQDYRYSLPVEFSNDKNQVFSGKQYFMVIIPNSDVEDGEHLISFRFREGIGLIKTKKYKK